MKTAECHLQNRSLFHAAKCFDQVNKLVAFAPQINIIITSTAHFPQAILIMKEQNKLDEIEALAHRACKLYQQQGSPEAGASSLEKAAKIVEHTIPEHALNLYQHALEVVTVRKTRNLLVAIYFSTYKIIYVLAGGSFTSRG